jgi:DNA-binding transcriptional MerR regulator
VNATPGFKIAINNVNIKSVGEAVNFENRREFEEKFASYWFNYPNFKIFFNSTQLNFESIICRSDQKEVTITFNELTYRFILKIIEWRVESKKKTYLCNSKGIPYKETNLGIRSSIPISMFIQSNYIEKLHRNNLLDINELDDVLNKAYIEAKKFAKDYVRQRLHQYSKEFISELKEKGLYPYKGPAENIIEETKRQVFDIVALQINEHLPNFNDQDDISKKLTLSLIREALENDSKSLKRILSEVIELPEDKRDELSDLLEKTSLSSMIDTMTEIKNRLNFLTDLEEIIYDSDINKNFKERKHLHKIVKNETWIFGDEYTYGVDDVTLKNVLKAYLRDGLKREDFEEIVNSEDNSNLQTIPDVCLWHQYNLGSAGKENLVIELKKPTVDAGWDEKTQIESYASKVVNDSRFTKEKTRWKFLLVTREIKPEIEHFLHQQNRKYGQIVVGDNYEIFILPWGHIISESKLRHDYIKEKLNLNLEDDDSGLSYIKSKYAEYLPNDFAV